MGSLGKRTTPEFNPRTVRSKESRAMEETLNLRLAGGPRAPSRARHALKSLDQALDDVRGDATLLVSELVTNSVRHGDAADADTTIELLATAAPDKVRVEVTD